MAWTDFVAAALLAAPFAMGCAALVGVDRFRRHAFGLYTRFAAAYMGAIFAGMVYYALVLVQQLQGGQFAAMTEWPLTPFALLLYGQSVAICVAFGLAGRSAVLLDRIVSPPPVPGALGTESGRRVA